MFLAIISLKFFSNLLNNFDHFELNIGLQNLLHVIFIILMIINFFFLDLHHYNIILQFCYFCTHLKQVKIKLNYNLLGRLGIVQTW